MMAKPCRKDLLQWINVVSFAIDDVKLFLDTHPCDQNALAYFQEYSRMRNEALKEYAKYYGPLTIDTAAESCADRWKLDQRAMAMAGRGMLIDVEL